jgi:epoxyqueuosine reductase QueG
MTDSNRIQSTITKLAADQGFQAVAMISVSGLLQAISSRLPHGTIRKAQTAIEGYFGREVTSAPSDYSLLVCGLSCYRNEADDPPPVDKTDESGLIAQFARRHYYREATEMLKRVFREFRGEAGARRRDMKIFCNSRLNEKLIGWASGLGSFGKNSLLINPLLGSRFIVSGLLLDIGLPEAGKARPGTGEMCGDCTACIDSCPVGAIGANGKIDGTKCIQALATQVINIPESTMDKWRYVIYGCDICQNACPYNRDLTLESTCNVGEIGPAISLTELLSTSPESLDEKLRKSALDFSWIDRLALRRNALIASGNRKNPALANAIRPYLAHQNRYIRETAEWAARKIVSA